MKITFKIGLLITFVFFSLITIFVNTSGIMSFQEGVMVDSVEKNTTIFEQGLRQGMTIISINNQEIKSIKDYTKAMSIFDDNMSHRVEILTKEIEIINIFNSEIMNQIIIKELPSTRIKTGLDIQGGARALVTGREVKLISEDIDDLIDVSRERLNTYGLTDIQLRKVSDLSGNNFMLVEIAGSSPEDLESLIEEQGKFEAKIGNKTVFVGGDKDITYIAMAGQDAQIYDCQSHSGGEVCYFRFSISLSQEAAQRHADITSELKVNTTSNGRYLEKQIDFFVDGMRTSSLNIGADLKGNVATQIQISGSGEGTDRKTAIDSTNSEMKKLQTILKTGSLPFKLKIVKIDKISPKLGEEFTQKILFAGLLALIAVSLVVFVRYRKVKASLALIFTSVSELIIILGFAALINWNLDLPSIAGIIAAIGTGIDSQIVILDEIRVKGESIKQRIKKALFIIVTAYLTTLVALIPLTGWLGFMGIGAASAGLLKGFAFTTLIGITIGVLITRPAFADITRQIESD